LGQLARPGGPRHRNRGLQPGYLLHIVRSMKSSGKAACILPHGVLFRGNAEAMIRQNLVRSGFLKGIVGLPANLFYGTGIPACIVMLDKENAAARVGIFMIDASKGFRKDGAKNRLREQDIHKIVDTFRKQDESDPRYARMVPLAEIADPRNDYNLNLSRYIDGTELEDLQDIDGHLRGGIPERDLDAVGAYWQIMPALRATLTDKNAWERAAEAEGTTDSERALARLARKAFLSLWSYPNVYSDEGRSGGKGDGKELVDLLVGFGNDVLLFSDKHCAFPQAVDITVAWPRWYKRAVEKSARQDGLLTASHRIVDAGVICVNTSTPPSDRTQDRLGVSHRALTQGKSRRRRT
jgi:hypothetical protein